MITKRDIDVLLQDVNRVLENYDLRLIALEEALKQKEVVKKPTTAKK